MIFLIDYKTLNEIIVELISNIHANIPEADTKIGTFLRDAIIDPFSLSLSKLYTQMKKMEMGQSILTAIGNDLETLAANFFIYRKSGSKSVGKVRFYIANTLLSDMDYAPKYQDIYIPKGTKVVAKYSNNTIPIQFETMVATSIKGDTVYYLNRDQTGYKYVEILCKSVNTGSNTNIGRYEINAMANNNISGIYSVSNYEKFKNGADDESDESLALRVGLALFANNIGTKNGYLSFILKQSQVIDAKIVAAGDKEMKRDIVTVVDDDGNLKEINMGGCVDVYVRTNTESSDTMNITVESSNIKTDGSVVVDINSALEEIPIITVQTITGSRDENGIIKYTTYTENDNEAGYNYRVYTDTKENENMINKESMKKMKDGVVIINTSRGKLINSADLIEELSAEKIGGVGLDVFDDEGDFFLNDMSNSYYRSPELSILLSMPNVVITSHQAFFTKEALNKIGEVTMENIKNYFETGECENFVE